MIPNFSQYEVSFFSRKMGYALDGMVHATSHFVLRWLSLN